jgi:hypothetical protein
MAKILSQKTQKILANYSNKRVFSSLFETM